jgi:anaerobic magnesium-protoporphyrin IX monomethyl ester cyclase
VSTLLLEPLMTDKAKWGRFNVGKGFVPPMGMFSIYSYLKSRGKTVRFIDTQFGEYGEEDIKKLLASDKGIKTVGIPVFTNTAFYSFRTAKICKEANPGVKIVLGGVHATALPERSFKECPSADYIVLGEGELTFDELIERIEAGRPAWDVKGVSYMKDGKFTANESRPLIQNLDDLPVTDYDNIDLSRYVPHPTQYKVLPNFPMLTQRGCPYKCTFCDASLIHGKQVRQFSVDRIISELELLVKKHGAKGIYFQDSTFTMKKEWAAELCEKMIAKNLKLQWACNTRVDRVDPELLKLMKRAGCWMINYGIETANQRSLDMLKKGTTVEQAVKSVEDTKRAGIDLTCNFILCLPGENAEMVENTIRFSKQLFADMSLFWLPVPYPGSELAETCKREGGLREDAKWEDYISFDFENPVYVNPLIGAKGMRDFYRRAYREYYLNPGYILKMLAKLRTLDGMRRYFRGFMVILNAFVVKITK